MIMEENNYEKYDESGQWRLLQIIQKNMGYTILGTSKQNGVVGKQNSYGLDQKHVWYMSFARIYFR